MTDNRFRESPNTKTPPSLNAYFNDYMAQNQLSASDIVNASGLRSYGYQLLNKTREKTSRDKMLALCIGAKMSLSETKFKYLTID